MRISNLSGDSYPTILSNPPLLKGFEKSISYGIATALSVLVLYTILITGFNRSSPLCFTMTPRSQLSRRTSEPTG